MDPFSRLFSLALLWTTVASFAIVTAPAAEFSFGHGTAVVVLRSPKAIYASVDSKEITSSYRGGSLSTEEGLMCRIGTAGPYSSIASGMVRGTNGLDALQEISRMYSLGDDLEKLASAARELIPRKLSPLLEAMLDADPAMFAKTYAGQAALQLALMWWSSSRPSSVRPRHRPDRQNHALSRQLR